MTLQTTKSFARHSLLVLALCEIAVVVSPASAAYVKIRPGSVSLRAGQQQQFTATVNGSSDSAVTWSISPSIGSISSSGLYTAPVTVPSSQTVKVTATSADDAATSASSTVTLAPVAVGLSPSTATLRPGQQQQFRAAVNGSSNRAVTWLIWPPTGSISSSGLYAAPGTASSSQTVMVTARSVADATKSASSTITVLPPIEVVLSPSTASLGPGHQQQFTAQVNWSSNSGVTWSISPPTGSISSSGLYVAPGTVASPQTVVVTATSVADATKSASSAMTLTVRDPNAGPTIGVQNATVKVRPGDQPPTEKSISLSAARNEFEAFQIIIDGGASGVTGVDATVSNLTKSDGSSISSSQILLYYEGLYNAVHASNTEGATGYWPDPLIPKVDAYYHEARNAFPFDVPANENRGIWVEVFVPPGTPAGIYQGSVTVVGTGLATTDVPVWLQVRAFDLPSTATLKSSFGMGWDGGCLTHLGSYNACGEDGVASYVAMYSRVALDHRVSLSGATYGGDRNDHWRFFDSFFGPQIGGTANTRLKGARLTNVGFNEMDISRLQGWHDHFVQKGWADRLFQYTYDEPSSASAWTEIPVTAATVHAAGVRTLVTTDIDKINENNLANAIDIAVPLVNFMQPRDGQLRRPDYDPFLALSPAKEVWMYQSCMSHGCAPTNIPYFTGWPSYVIDASGVQNRAMEWLSFKFDVTGELYFQTTHKLATAWENQWDFDGNGDGTLFYPGMPARIGGATDIPIESIRLKLIREGMEDYEYLHLLCTLGDCAFAQQTATALLPTPNNISGLTASQVYAARAAIADRIESLLFSRGLLK